MFMLRTILSFFIVYACVIIIIIGFYFGQLIYIIWFCDYILKNIYICKKEEIHCKYLIYCVIKLYDFNICSPSVSTLYFNKIQILYSHVYTLFKIPCCRSRSKNNVLYIYTNNKFKILYFS